MSRSDEQFERIARESEAAAQDSPAPSQVKARLYTALIAKQQEAGELRTLSETAAEGRRLCVFEQLVQIAPAGLKAESIFYCKVCHARVLAEYFDNPPIYWPNCPYVQLKNE